MNEYQDPEFALAYLGRGNNLPHRVEGEAIIFELIPDDVRRILDLGAGDGRMLSNIRRAYPQAKCVALDFSPTMLAALRQRFAGNSGVSIVEHDLEQLLPDLASLDGPFDVILSAFAIHHLTDERKRSLYAEIYTQLAPGGVFCNLEHVSSPTPALHAAFYQMIGATVENEDPSNKLASVEDQLAWLRSIGYRDVDCFWKWREFALLVGWR